MNLQQYNLLKAQILERSFGRLNEMQREAVYTTTGPVLILAGAGSGKTTVIINRIVNLLRFGAAAQRSDYLPRLTEEEEALLCRAATDGTDLEAAGELIAVDRPKPWNVLAITFTNKAAGELRERLTAALGDVGKDVAAATFHSTCVRILRSEIGRLGYSSSFTIYDSDDSLRIIKECMAELNLDEKQFAPRMLMSHISGAKDKLLSAEEMAKVGGDNFVYQTAAKVYTKYQFKLKNANAVDFDDIIILTVKLFQEYPEVLEKYRNRWKYVMVDEYQDTNHIQYLLVSLLAAGHNNVCVVGDDDQSIYKFRGATIENILSFESQFQSTKVIRLEQNYRCTSKILDA
ncbi:MAG: UvrD-helicase domain-containing protein, partial [Angelakisella sp.]